MRVPLTARVRVRTYELDSFGHVNNAAYLNYLEEARSEFLRQMGLSFHDFARLGVQLVIIEAHLHYKHPARYGDEIEISATFRDVRSASAYIDYTLTEIHSGRVIATANDARRICGRRHRKATTRPGRISRRLCGVRVGQRG